MHFLCISSVALLVLVSLTMGAPSDTGHKPIYNLDDAPELFEKFIKDYNKSYKNEADKQSHYAVFRKSLETINKLNSDPNQGATFGINQFADENEEEFKKHLGVLTN